MATHTSITTLHAQELWWCVRCNYYRAKSPHTVSCTKLCEW